VHGVQQERLSNLLQAAHAIRTSRAFTSMAPKAAVACIGLVAALLSINCASALSGGPYHGDVRAHLRWIPA